MFNHGYCKRIEKLGILSIWRVHHPLWVKISMIFHNICRIMGSLLNNLHFPLGRRYCTSQGILANFRLEVIHLIKPRDWYNVFHFQRLREQIPDLSQQSLFLHLRSHQGIGLSLLSRPSSWCCWVFVHPVVLPWREVRYWKGLKVSGNLNPLPKAKLCCWQFLSTHLTIFWLRWWLDIFATKIWLVLFSRNQCLCATSTPLTRHQWAYQTSKQIGSSVASCPQLNQKMEPCTGRFLGHNRCAGCHNRWDLKSGIEVLKSEKTSGTLPKLPKSKLQ